MWLIVPSAAPCLLNVRNDFPGMPQPAVSNILKLLNDHQGVAAFGNVPQSLSKSWLSETLTTICCVLPPFRKATLDLRGVTLLSAIRRQSCLTALTSELQFG
jgi:hypothetical protein